MVYTCKFLAALLLSLLVLSGCKSSSDSVFGVQPQPAPSVGTIQLSQVLLRAVPTEVTQQRFTGFDAAGDVRFGPVTEAKAATITLENVSTAVTRLQIEYLQGDTVIGLGSMAVVVVPGETTEINDPPFQDVASALNSIQVSPGGTTIADGSGQQFTAIGTFADNAQVNLTSSVTWASSDPTTATINPVGLATAVDPGSTVISANLGPISGNADLTVSTATISSVSVTPGAPSIADGTTQQFITTATLSDNSVQDVTNTATWSSATPAVATINANTGLATAVEPGQSVVTATVGSVSGNATLTVTGASVVSLAVTPGAVTLANGTTQQFTAIATLSDMSQQNATSSADWTSATPATATVNDTGLAGAVAPGSSVITATFGGKNADGVLTVTAATIDSIAVTPNSPVIADGTIQQFTATATLSDNNTQDVTNTAAWTSGTPATAGIETMGQANPGLATAVDPGQSLITASVGAVSGSTTLTVANATVTTVVVTPVNQTIADGTTLQSTAMANFSSGPPQNVTSSATWTSSVPATASITPGGLATAESPNATPTVITATFDGQSGSTDLTVTAATIESIAVTPATPAIADGTTQQFTATATLTDTTTQDVTNTAAWVSDTPATAAIETMGQANPGLATAVDPGQSLITATVNTVSGSTTLTVTPATIQSIAINPPLALSAPGTKRRYQAIATFSDATTQDVTSQVTWSANNGVTVANDNLGPNRAGEATIPATGATTPVTIAANLGAQSANSTLNFGRFAYVANFNDGDVSAFTIDPITGVLGNRVDTAAGVNPISVTVDPTGRFAYVANFSEDDVSAFTIDPSTGVLGNRVDTAAGGNPISVTVDPTRRFAYVANFSDDDDVSAFTIDPTTGALGNRMDTAAGARPRSVTVDPTGRFAYVANQAADDVSAFTIDPTTGVLGNRMDTVSGDNPRSVTVDPTGRFAYVVNSGDGDVSVFTIDPTTGVLGNRMDTAVGSGPVSVTVDPTGGFAYVANQFDNDVSVFTIDPTTGVLGNRMDTAAGNAPVSVTVDPTGRFAYVANQFDDNVSAFTLDPATGVLGNRVDTAAGDVPFSVVTTP